MDVVDPGADLLDGLGGIGAGAGQRDPTSNAAADPPVMFLTASITSKGEGYLWAFSSSGPWLWMAA